MHKKKILIVDDERPLSDLLLEALEMEGTYIVDQAFNGAEGVEKYKKLIPDLVIMDINMPVMDGYESSVQIKSFDPSARILVLTGNASDSRAKKNAPRRNGLDPLTKTAKIGRAKPHNTRQFTTSLKPGWVLSPPSGCRGS